MEIFADIGYLGLFLAAFLAATILPLGSEVVLSAMLVTGYTPVLVILVATLANVLGALSNYAIGYWASKTVVKKWLKLSDQDIARAERQFEKYGILSLCFAWVPIIGDPITVMAGIMKIKLGWFVALVSIGKLFRYLVVAYITLQI